MGSRPHYQLDAWRESITLVKQVYELTKSFPPEELYGLTNQIRRAAVSIPSNIAEGAARNGSKEFAQFLGIAKGSLSELETQLVIGRELGYLQAGNGIFAQHDLVSKLVSGLHRHITRQ